MAPTASVVETPDSRLPTSTESSATRTARVVPLRRAPTPEPFPRAKGTEAPRILVVDDSPAMRRIVIRTLRRAGLGEQAIHEAGSGEEALSLVRAGLVDLVLSDWNMPGMNGVELLRRLRAEGLEVELGFITSEASKMRAEALEAGARFVISKPVTVESVRAALGELLGAAGSRLPTQAAVAELLAALLGQPVSVQPDPRSTGVGPVVAGLFEEDSPRRAQALLVCDQALAAALATAMLGEPAEKAVAWAALPRLPEEAMESMTELLRVAAALFGSAETSPMGLLSVHDRLLSLPSRAVALAVTAMSPAGSSSAAGSNRGRSSFRVELGALGGGRMLFVG